MESLEEDTGHSNLVSARMDISVPFHSCIDTPHTQEKNKEVEKWKKVKLTKQNLVSLSY